MKKNKMIIIMGVVIILLIGGYFVLTYLFSKDLEEQNDEYQETLDQYGYVEEENVTNLVAKFNTEVMDRGVNYPASEDYFTTADADNTYWYGLYDDIYLYIEPLEYTSNRDKDIVDIMAINFPKESENQEMALGFAKCLIKANNDKLTEEEIDSLLAEAEEVSKDKGVANNGQGITVALAEGGDIYEYQVVRIYK